MYPSAIAHQFYMESFYQEPLLFLLPLRVSYALETWLTLVCRKWQYWMKIGYS